MRFNLFCNANKWKYTLPKTMNLSKARLLFISILNMNKIALASISADNINAFHK